MERKDNDREGSPLPSSLIPHLMTRDSSTRTTLDSTRPIPSSATEPHDLAQPGLPYMRSNPPLLPPLAADAVLSSYHHSSRPYFSLDPVPLNTYGRYAASLGSGGMPPITDRGERLSSASDPSNIPPTSGFRNDYDDPYSLPHLPPLRASSVARPSFTQREQLWDNPEAGPSSQVLLPRHEHRGRGQRGHSQSRLELPQQDSLYRRRNSPDAAYVAYGPDGEFLHQEAEESYTQESEIFTPPGGGVNSIQPSRLFQDFPASFPYQQADIPDPRQLRSSYSPSVIDSLSLDPFARRSSIEYPPADSDSGHGRPSTSLSRQKEGKTPQSKKRRRTQSAGTDESAPTQTRNLKKTILACNFCRARKIRCDGKKLKCSNCLTRGLDCEYESNVKRRGPGKASKASKVNRSKTREASMKASEHISPDDRPSGSSDNDQGPIAPELQVSSVGMGFNFTNQPPDTMPPFSSLPFRPRGRSQTPL